LYNSAFVGVTRVTYLVIMHGINNVKHAEVSLNGFSMSAV